MGKHQVKEKKMVAKFAGVKSEDGWSLGINSVTKRFDLKKDEKLVLSDVGINPCLGRAAEHSVKWEVEPKLEWSFE